VRVSIGTGRRKSFAVVLLAPLLLSALIGIGSHPGMSPRSPSLAFHPEALRPATAANISGWTQVNVSSPNAPLPGAGYALAFDPQLSAVVSFGGGQSGGEVQGYTWEFARGVWTNLTGTVGPAPTPRSAAAVVADPQVGGLLLYGGLAGSGAFDTDTWSFSNGHWTDLTNNSSSPPTGRFAPAMAYDSSDGEVVLFGGENQGGSHLNDTWTFAHGNWTNISGTTTGAPSPRRYAAIADDPADHGVLLFGGQDASGTFGDTWEFAAGHWHDLSPSLHSSPPARRAAMMAYDSTNRSVLLFGGDSSITGTGLADTWRFQLGRWWDLTGFVANPPGARFATGMSDDATDNGTVFVGGCTAVGCTSYLGDTWNWRDVPLQVSISPLEVAGYVPLHASFTASVTGGLPPYAYSWKNGTGPVSPGSRTWNGTFPAAEMVNIDVYASDEAGGNVSTAGSVDATTHSPPPPPLAVSLNSTSIAGRTPLIVRLHATATGGLPPYGFLWQNGTATAFATGDAFWNGTFSQVGNFTLTVSVRDTAGNVSTAKASIAVSAKPVSGNGGHPGSNSSSPAFLPAWAWAALVIAAAALVIVALLIGRRRRRGGPPEEGQFDEPEPAVATSSVEPAPPAGSTEVSALAGAPIGPGASGFASSSEAVSPDAGPAPAGASGPSLSNRILLHLYGLGALRPSDIAPLGRTQEGIAAALGRPQGSFVRVLLRLEESGLLMRELRHVQGKGRRVQVYALTDRGYQMARGIRPGTVPTPARSTCTNGGGGPRPPRGQITPEDATNA
jgi:hypothetical protein